MLFNSFEFIFAFLPVVYAGYLILFRTGRPRLVVIWLIAASLFYYGWWNPRYLLLIGALIIGNYACARAIHALRNAGREQAADVTMWAGIVGNLTILGYYKYANFLVDSLNDLSGASLMLAPILLPVGISFFTFQKIAYLVDTRYRDPSPHTVLEFSLFVLFFPQLLAGPITHHREILPQFHDPNRFRPRSINLAIGLTIFAIGLFKKVVIADGFAAIATPVFTDADQGQAIAALAAWRGAFAYTIQLYFDFSGYSDMAIGLARIFGINLPLNFNAPYRATGIIDFWRRWHMTLSRFLQMYLYIPLGGNRRGQVRRYVNLMLTMLIGGLWHGAGWNFILWGGLHGAFLIVNHGWRRLLGPPSEHPLARAAARLLTFTAVMLALVLFRAETLDGALGVYAAMSHSPALDGALARNLSWLVLWLAVLWLWPTTQQIMRYQPPAFDDKPARDDPPPRWFRPLADRLTWRPSRGWALAAGALFAFGLLNLTQVSEFLYYRF
jgi:D-alanyl-lipoteichoic acid acyltransferase DltB (MBOAT superfamily)